jgi:hypothetical protein
MCIMSSWCSSWVLFEYSCLKQRNELLSDDLSRAIVFLIPYLDLDFDPLSRKDAEKRDFNQSGSSLIFTIVYF